MSDNRPHGVSRGLTLRYGVALALIATLVTASYVSLRVAIAEQENMAAIVNVSGRQRMLSQRVALFCQALVSARLPKERERHRERLTAAIDLMEISHNGLTRGSEDLGLPDTMSDVVRGLYFEPPHDVDARVRGYLRTARALSESPAESLPQISPLVTEILEVGPGGLLASLDALVTQYQVEGEASVARVAKIELVVWLMALSLLVLEVTLIFRPMVRLVARNEGILQVIVAERTAELEAANRDLEAFVYSASHDMKAPLRAIDGYTAMLTESHGSALGKGGQRLLGAVRSSAQRMARLIDDLLAFSRTGQAEMAITIVDMKELAQTVFSDLSRMESDRVIEFSVGELPTVPADLALTRQVWANLLENALKFTGHREAARIEVDFEEEPDYWVFRVRDNGVGFDMEYVDRLFGVFQRFHRQEEFPGTGVGLATVQRIVQRHGGEVWAEGEVDVGATVFFRLRRTMETGSAGRPA